MFVKFRQNFIKISKKNTNFHAFFMKFELNKLFRLFKNDKIVTTFLLKFWDLSGAKVWKSCRSRKSWKNEYLVAIVAVDTAENGPPKVWRNWIKYSVVSLVLTPASEFSVVLPLFPLPLSIFFREKKSACTFFSPDRRDCRSRKMLKNAPTLAIIAIA